MSARPGKHRARLTNNRTERESICSKATFPCCAKLFFQLGKNVKGESENVKVYKQSLSPAKGPSAQVEDMKPNLRFASNLVI